jgi:hypothetical protein
VEIDGFKSDMHFLDFPECKIVCTGFLADIILGSEIPFGLKNIVVTATDYSGHSTTHTYKVILDNPNYPTPGSGNLALNKIVTVSSTQSTNAAARAVDGIGNTRWSSLYSDQQWIRVDLGSTKSVKKVILQWEAAYG